jgi:uncharacterized protein
MHVHRKEDDVLLRFEFSNHRSIMTPVELSMIAVDQDREATRGFDSLDERVLTVAGIYGPNASGKSNVLDALSWLSLAVRSSLRIWNDEIPRDSFKFGRGPVTPSEYQIELMVDGVRYEYHLEVDDSAVLFEGLYSYPERRRRTLFERDGMELSFRRGLGRVSGTRKLITPTTLALSAAMRFDEPSIRRFAYALAGIGVLVFPRSALRRRMMMTRHRMSTRDLFLDGSSEEPSLFDSAEAEPASDRSSALALLRFADLGIENVEVVDEIIEEVSSSGKQKPEVSKRLQFLHKAAGEQLPFSPSEESEGTMTWFRLIGPTIGALRSGQVLLFDEIESSLHPRLSSRLIELFQDPDTNPHGAQLIFTSHDTSLLNHLNRDEVWLTEKGSDGRTTLTALAEYGGDKVRRSLNLEKAYLQGRFGAVPELDQFVLRRALGLTRNAS